MIGDIVYVERKPLWFGNIQHRLNPQSTWLDKLIARVVLYRHYGVEIEENEIIHFYCTSIFNLQAAKIQITTKEDFLKNDGALEVESIESAIYDKWQVAQRAKTMLNTSFDGYHINKNNCEHFALWCATGYRFTRQKPWTTAYRTFGSASVTLKAKVATLIISIIGFI